MLPAQLAGAAATSRTAVPVVLFLRIPGRPYVFAGQCDAEAVDTMSQPIRVQWHLRHFDALCAQAQNDQWLDGWRELQDLVFSRHAEKG
jgi:hypothetical protein